MTRLLAGATVFQPTASFVVVASLAVAHSRGTSTILVTMRESNGALTQRSYEHGSWSFLAIAEDSIVSVELRGGMREPPASWWNDPIRASENPLEALALVIHRGVTTVLGFDNVRWDR